MSDLISVVVPVYNPGKHFVKCLESLANQTYQNLEILLVDDGSTDGSGEICRQYAAKDDRFHFFRQENAGVSAARNRGLEAARGAYISFVDSDDYLERNAYELLLSEAKKHAVDIVCFEYFATYADHESVHTLSDQSRYGRKKRKEAMREQVTGVPFLWTKLFSAATVRNIRFKVGLARGEDGEFACRAIHNAKSVFYSDVPLLHYVQSEQSATRGKFRRSQLSFLSAFPENEAFFSEHYPELLHYVRASFIKTAIMLYCDMYADGSDFDKEKKETHACVKSVYQRISKSKLGRKEKIKYRFFVTAPKTFAWVHVRRFHYA